MSAVRPALKLNPERCDRCGRCVGRCKPHAIKLGPGYIYIDSERCDGCLACADVCDRGAITRRDRQPQTAPAARPKAGAPGAKVQSSKTDSIAATSPWTAADALVALVVLLACLIAVNLGLSTEPVRLMPASGKVIARVVGLGLTYGVELLVLFALARRQDMRFGAAFGLVPVARSLRSALTSTLLVIGLLIGTRLIATGYALITQAFPWEPSVNWGIDLTRVFGPDRSGFVLTVILAVVLGPFVEELVFRCVALSALGRRWGATGGILISSALFATYHFSLWMFVPIFVLGLALGWLTDRSQGLWPAISLHMLYNGVTVAAAFWVVWQ